MANVEYQANTTALVEKIKTAVRCSHLWVLPSAPTPGRGGRACAPPPPPAELDRLHKHLLNE